MDNSRQSVLDRMWYHGGTQGLRQFFSTTARKSRREALRMINDEALSFPVLFILSGDIYTLNLYRDMSLRNKTAMRLCALKTMPADWFDTSMETADTRAFHATLRWMITTGKTWDGPLEGHDAYDAVLDYVSALLTGSFEDKAVLGDIAELIFRRNRKGYYIHDLVWSFFQMLDADILLLVVNRLKSGNSKDVELASKLLGVDTPLPMDSKKMKALFEQYTSWLEENRPYLYLTGEHFQMTSHPIHLNFDREAKYLQKAILPRERTPAVPLTEDETDRLFQYRQAPEDEQEVLSAYSQRLRTRDKRLWDDWMQGHVAEQVIAARKDEADDYY